ncbi:MAG: tyrosine-type recombinase/integrase [Solirubrobacteraceae bacterium]
MAGSKRVPVEGPLGLFADGFAVYLTERGYSRLSVREHLRRVRHMSRWMTAERLEVAQLTAAVVQRFLDERRRQGKAVMISPQGSRPLLSYLEGLGVLGPDDRVRTPVELLLEDFRSYLLGDRALQASTASLYEATARVFLAERPEPLSDDLARVTGAEISAFVVERSRAGSVSATSNVICALRALLSFLHVRGYIPRSLVCAVPSVAKRSSLLPRALDADQVALLFASCERQCGLCRRDLAILKLLCRLGLRAGEVAKLELEHIEWQAGEVLVIGKGRRLGRLPLPHDVGEAIVDYLREERPDTACRALFLTSVAPLVGLSSGAVTAVVARAGRRAGLAPVGAHRLRHTAATEMLRAGASLPEVGQVLRHRRLQTTAVYARVDRERLQALALPWPEVIS